MVRAAPTTRDRTALITVVMRAAWSHRDQGVSWSEIAIALGVTENTLRRWRRTEDTKPMPPSRPTVASPSHTELPSSPRRRTDTTRSRFETIPARMSQSQSQTSTFTASVSISARGGSEIRGAVTPSSGTRRVLVVSGDPRPANNSFGPETAVIRRCLSSAYIDVRELACIELSELARYLDELCPSVLHVAAHSSFGGISLSLDGSPLSIGYEAFIATIKRSFRPRLVVMNVCGSHALSGDLTSLVPSVITWPDVVDDNQSRVFASQLYQALATERTVSQAYHDSCTILERWPGLRCPVLTGNHAGAIF
ncbi:MAG: helix-turn-helix domain-containing protein [Pseudonocardiales bacterium]|nr:helix-turn-helix domain-containing protein [Pseudonocardiales bacterium]